MKRLKTGGWRRQGFVRSLDLGRLMGVVEQLCPAWQARRHELKQLAHTLPVF